ncbi:MAG: prepilin-type N-terminal cleavage/methylation domain-containing protein, partial [Candidatus Omnitrophota bacterium]
MEEKILIRVNNKNRRSFTLLELIIVLIIIGVITTLGFVYFGSIVEYHRASEAREILGFMDRLQMQYIAEHRQYANNAVALGLIDYGIPISCQGTHFYRYDTGQFLSWRGNAYRCLAGSGGKYPDAEASGPYYDLEYDYGLRTITYNKTSCPLLFAYNGEGYSFVSDFLGSSVLGFYIGKLGNRQLYTPIDGDEYIKVSSAQLKEDVTVTIDVEDEESATRSITITCDGP